MWCHILLTGAIWLAGVFAIASTARLFIAKWTGA